jgi:hypothetical protein
LFAVATDGSPGTIDEVRFWRRKVDGDNMAEGSRPAAETDRLPDDRPERWHLGGGSAFSTEWLSPSGMPESLRPKDDPDKTKVFDDEVDPAWRDPETSN